MSPFEKPVREITHGAHLRRLVIHNPASNSWHICYDSNVIKQRRYVAISYRYVDIVPQVVDEPTRVRNLLPRFKLSWQLNESAYWIDPMLVDPANKQESLSQVDVYCSAKFTRIMLSLDPPPPVTEDEAWLNYGKRLWTLPEALLSRELQFKFRDDDVKPIPLFFKNLQRILERNERQDSEPLFRAPDRIHALMGLLSVVSTGNRVTSPRSALHGE
ncbi:hypothetical protein JVU11DRAFT_8766 [Chiua virens]|nr:hypothetical protein JVU11DRAFT_8766 [Chiua virens]